MYNKNSKKCIFCLIYVQTVIQREQREPMDHRNLIKLLIVDDDRDVRVGMTKEIEWERLGYFPIAQAENGLDAIEKIKQEVPDVVLTDIKMDKMDGMALISYLSDHYPSIKIVLVSGYSDIAYYQKALEYKVFDFILKPTSIDNFEKVFSKLKEVIDREDRQNKKITFLEKATRTNSTYSKQNFLQRLLKNDFSGAEEIRYILQTHSLDLKFENLFVICIGFYYDLFLNKGKQGGTEQARKVVLQVLESEMEAIPHIICARSRNEIVCLCNGQPDAALRDKLNRVMLSARKTDGSTVFAGVSESCPDLMQCGVFYKQAYVAMRQITYLTKETVILYSDLNDFPILQKVDFDHTDVINSLFFMKDEGWKQQIETVFDSCIGQVCYDYDYIDIICSNLYFDVLEQLTRILPEYSETENFYSIISEIWSLSGKKAFFIQTLSGIQFLANFANTDNKSKLISVIDQVINQNFTNPQLSLTFISEAVGKTSAYISNFYKQETNRNINDVITRKRIEYAKKLLEETDLKTYHIAEEVGYADCSYFTKIFKKNVGVSPKQYRDSGLKAGK